MKTTPNQHSVTDYLNSVEPAKKRLEGFRLLEIFREETGEEAVMWGNSIIGFGQYHYQYESGREGDWMLTGFSPRKVKHSLYIMPGFKRFDDLMQKLGKYKTGVSCLYVNKLADINEEVLRELIRESVEYMREKYNA